MYKNYVFLLLLFFFINTLNCQVVDIITGIDPSKTILLGNLLFFTQDDKISYIDITETNPIEVELINNVNNPVGLEVKDNFLYVAVFGDGEIIKLDLSVPNPNPIDVTFFGQTPNMLEFEGNNLYYTDNNGKRIYRKDITSSSTAAENFLNTTPTGPVGLAIKDNYIYFNLPLQGSIFKLGLDDPQGTPILVASGLNRPIGMKFKNDELFIADVDGDKIVKIDVTATPIVLEDVLTNLDMPSDISFDGDIMYISEFDKISKIDLSLSVNDNTLNELKLYPNPTTDYLKVSNLSTSLKYDIKDINGRSLQKGTLIPNGQIDITPLATGTYFITFNGETSVTKKFLKQ
jgi:hypothetical protein